MPAIRYDAYYRYEELRRLLHDFQTEHPDLVQVSSIGKSHEGRDIFLVTVTDAATGPAKDKPAFWCDGNIHASELSASTAVLTILAKAVSDHRELLATRALYLVPRLNPDGAEWAMETPPRIIRSSTRPYPFDEEDPYGLEPQDIDGDGRILQFRVVDPNGPWKVAEEEPRLLKRREPGESGGTYYRLVTEGLFHNFDGLTMRSRRRKEGLDMNRNFPNEWRQEHEQPGAGPFPTSEPEIRAAVHAIVERPNICGAVTFHTFSGVNLRPPSNKPDDSIPAEDLWTYKTIGAKGTEMSGYPPISVYHDFRYHPKQVITGVFDDWMFAHRGVYAWTTEIWSPQRQAGITDYKYIDWYREHPIEDDLKLLKWSDEKLGGQGYVDWRPFEHPQLGPVEIGGWDGLYAFRNPPFAFLESELSPLADWALWQASLTPRLTVLRQEFTPVGDGVSRLRIAVQNTGWLPTSVTRHAEDSKLVRGIQAEIRLAEGASVGRGNPTPAWLVSGALRQTGGQLTGWSHVGAFPDFEPTTDVTTFEWVLQTDQEYVVEISHERAGRITVNVPSASS